MERDVPPKGLVQLREGDSDDELEAGGLSLSLRLRGCWTRVVEQIQGSSIRFRIFLSFTWREMRKRPFSTCIASLSCLVVVCMVGLLASILDNVSAIFLRLAEFEAGEVDLRVFPLAGEGSSAINYNTVRKSLSRNSSVEPLEFSFHTPRILNPSTIVAKFSSCNVSEATRHLLNSNGTHDMHWAYYGEAGKHPSQCSSPGRYIHPSLCLRHYCPGFSVANLMAVDTEREERMGYGRGWGIGPIPKGKVVISKILARQLMLSPSDEIAVSIELQPPIYDAFRKLGILPDSKIPIDETHSMPGRQLLAVNMVLTIEEIVRTPRGKLSNSADFFMVVEYGTFYELLAQNINPDLPRGLREHIANIDPYTTATEVDFNLPPERFRHYRSNDYNEIQGTVLPFADQILYLIGYSQFSTSLPVLNFMKNAKFFSMFLGLLISIVGVVLTLMSVILIYSLLMINVELRTFEFGILRMVGLTRGNLVILVLTQAFGYAAPAWVVGLIVAQLLFLIVRVVVYNLLLVTLDSALSGKAVMLATVLGFLIPVVASIVPIASALRVSLNDSLDTRHSKTNAVEFKIERAGAYSIPWTVILCGLLMVVVGFTIYYLFPLALLSLNLTLLFYMFFGLLIGMLLGLVMLSLNLESVLENLLTTIFFFWENVAVRSLILKNLVAHRRRNRKTTTMYALSLGFVIWVSVMFQIQVDSYSYDNLRSYGSRLYLHGRYADLDISAAYALEKMALNNSLILDFAWITSSIRTMDFLSGDAYIANNGRYHFARMNIYGVTPNFYEVTEAKFLVPHRYADESGKTGLSRRLYSPEGSHSLLLGATYIDYLGLKDSSSRFQMVFSNAPSKVFSPLVFLDASPVVWVSRFPQSIQQSTPVSIPTLLRLPVKKRTVSELTFLRMQLKVPASITPDQKNAILFAAIAAMRNAGYMSDEIAMSDVDEAVKPVLDANEVVVMFLKLTTAIAMIMCFFSLTSSMVINVYEQAKEIGILRALGMGRYAVLRLYIWEAFVLVMAASIMGFVIGTAIAWTMGIQRVLFTQLPLPFRFPWAQLGIVVMCAFLTAAIAPLLPVVQLLRKPVVSVLR
eukprot:RCo016575